MPMKPIKPKVMAKPKPRPTVPPGKARPGKKIVDYVPTASAGKSNPASAIKGKGSPRLRNTEGIVKGKISKAKKK